MTKLKTTTKTWKIGERAKGGVITVEITGEEIAVIGKEWDFSTGSRNSSNQSNAKEFTRGTILSCDADAERKLHHFLSELSTSYFADEILKWIKSKITIKRKERW